MFAGAGGYIGEFPPPVERYLTWRDHETSPPWTLDEIAATVAFCCSREGAVLNGSVVHADGGFS